MFGLGLLRAVVATEAAIAPGPLPAPRSGPLASEAAFPSLGEQHRLAASLFEEIKEAGGAMGVETLEQAYQKVLRECPQSELAPEAAFRLANLYFESWDPPRVDPCLATLKLLHERYPDSPWARGSVHRLLLVAHRAGDWAFLAGYYPQILRREARECPDRVGHMIEFAEVLERLGQPQEARRWLCRVLEESHEGPMADLAKTLLDHAAEGGAMPFPEPTPGEPMASGVVATHSPPSDPLNDETSP